MVKPLILIKTGSSFTETVQREGDFEQLFLAGLGVEPRALAVCRVADGDALPNAAGFSGVLITGAHAMVTDGDPWIEPLCAWLRQAAAWSLPILGVCYGHQLLAQAFGGSVGNHPRGPEVGTFEVGLTPAGCADPLLGSLPPRFTAHLTHTQSVLTLPPGAEVLAANDYEPHQAFRVGANVWGVQFHPEFSAAVMVDYVRRQAPELARLGRDPQQVLAEVTETSASNGLLRRFAALAGVALQPEPVAQ